MDMKGKSSEITIKCKARDKWTVTMENGTEIEFKTPFDAYTTAINMSGFYSEWETEGIWQYGKLSKKTT